MHLPLLHRFTVLTVKDFRLLVRLKVFDAEQMYQAVFAFRRYEDPLCGIRHREPRRVHALPAL
jgi:hypothetical protein